MPQYCVMNYNSLQLRFDSLQKSQSSGEPTQQNRMNDRHKHMQSGPSTPSKNASQPVRQLHLLRHNCPDSLQLCVCNPAHLCAPCYTNLYQSSYKNEYNLPCFSLPIYSKHIPMRGEQRPCKFGNNCIRMAKGFCNFYHPPNSQPNRPNYQNPRRQMDSYSNTAQHQTSYNQPYSQPYNQTYNQPFNKTYNQPFNKTYSQAYNQPSDPFKKNKNNYSTNGFNSFSNQTFLSGSNYGDNGGFRGGNGDKRQLCLNFQLGIDCQFGDKCNRKHQFLFEAEDKMLRIVFIRQMPCHLQSKLSKFRFEQKDYFCIRNGNDVRFYEFSQANKFSEVFTYSLPLFDTDYHYYDQKGQYIYFARSNPISLLEDMGVYSILEKKTSFVANTHIGKVSGMAQFKDVLFTSSMNGELKTWIPIGQQFNCHPQTTEHLTKSFNPKNAKIKLHFVDVSELSGKSLITVGTSDGRLLIFCGEQLTFQQVQLPVQCSKVFRVKYTLRENLPMALVLSWNDNKTYCCIIQIALPTLAIRMLVQVLTTVEEQLELLHLFEVIHEQYLFVSNLRGVVSIYSYPDSSVKLGSIVHNNIISDIVESVEELKNTNTQIKFVMIMQKKTENINGSLAVYILR